METKISYLLDTCILVDFLRGNKSIYDILVNNKDVNLSISTITMMELTLGAFNKKEVLYFRTTMLFIYFNPIFYRQSEKRLFAINRYNQIYFLFPKLIVNNPSPT